MAQAHVNGIQLDYTVTGEGPALLLIHGLGSCKEDWEPQVVEFSRHYKVISFDLRGHGKSDKPEGPYNMQMFATDAAGLLKTLNIEAAHVVGISLGGAIAFQFALDHPSLTRTLTVVNSGPEAIVRTFKEKFAIWLRLFMVRRMGPAKLGQLLAKHLFPNPESKAAGEAFAARYAHNDKNAYRHAMLALIGWSVAAKIGTIRNPALIIAADQDYTPLSFKEAFVAKMPGAKLEVVRDARHALPMEKPAAFNAVLAQFLAMHTTQAA
ncbi:MAG: alpha/beta fold hydrolase [Burkholderiales bacterium]|nr:alpha/beta fold hydrolase [Burkholderiales bacterium]